MQDGGEIRDSFESGKLDVLMWIRCNDNVSDALTTMNIQA